MYGLSLLQSANYGDDDLENKASVFDSLPPEVKAKIYNKLHQPEVLRLRLVSKKLKEEIDDLYHFHIILDEDNPEKMRWLTNLKAQKCTLFCKGLNSGWLQFQTPGQNIFKYPVYLRTLQITLEENDTTECNYKEGISVENLNKILKQCEKYLEKLFIEIREITGPQPKFRCSFENIKELKLIVKTNENWKEFFLQILEMASNSQKLKGLDVSLKTRLFKNPEVIVALFNLIAELEKSLSKLKLCFVPNPYRYSKGTGTVCEFFANLSTDSNNLKTIHFNFDNGVMCPSLARCVNQLLSRQKNVQNLYLFGEDYVKIFPLLRRITEQNYESLNKIGISLPTESWLDGGNALNILVFDKCKHLQELDLAVRDHDENEEEEDCIDNFAIESDEEDEDKMELRNLERIQLPNLKILRVQGFLIPTDSLSEFFEQELEFLHQLDLDRCGKKGDFGLNATVLERILELPNIAGIEATGFNCEEEEELEKLNSILNLVDAEEVSWPSSFHKLYLGSEDIRKIREAQQSDEEDEFYEDSSSE